MKSLKQKGYKLLATTPDPEAMSVYDYKLDGKTALLFGTELTGLTQEALDMSDEKVRIPMFGFTESFNISVSAALCLSIFREKLQGADLDFHLSEEEILDIKLSWYRKIVKRSDLYLEKASLSDD